MSATATGAFQTTYSQRKRNRQTEFWQTDLIWLSIDGPHTLKPSKTDRNRPMTDDKYESFSQYQHDLTDQSLSTGQTHDIIDWQTLFTWLWMSKHQPPKTVLWATLTHLVLGSSLDYEFSRKRETARNLLRFVHVDVNITELRSCMFPPRFRNTETCDFVLWWHCLACNMEKAWGWRR